MNVYIHYNASELVIPDPQKDVWENYEGEDAARLFLIAARSWELQGWTVSRLDSSKVDGFHFQGALAGHLEYPLERWNMWFLLRELAPCILTTIDVLNVSFRDGVGLLGRCAESYSKPWSNTCIAVGKDFCTQVIETIEATDRGAIPLPRCQIRSDESIIRENETLLKNTISFDFCGLAGVSAGWTTKCLLHFPKSTLARNLQRYLVCK